MGRKSIYGPEHDEEIERLYVTEKLSMSEIGKRLDMPAMVVKRKLVKRGVSIRNMSVSQSLRFLRKQRAEQESQSQSGMNRTTGDLMENSDEEWLSE